jgi:gamma-glutamyltranspeptidase / glutathione hydrolase
MPTRLLAVVVSMMSVAWAQAEFAGRSHGRSIVSTTGGIVATSQVLASQAGAQILAQGGSAVDAAIAANLVLGVVEPMMCGIGGDMFAIYWDAKTGKLTGINASGPAPQGLTPEFLKAAGLKAMPGTGIHSATVPGAVDGFAKMHARFGKLPWKALFGPAIHYAEQGAPAQEMVQRVWKQKLVENSFFLPGGKAPAVGELVKNPDLGRAMRMLAEQGPAAFYKGAIAEAIVATSKRLGGTMSAGDLAGFASEFVEPISTTYRGWKVYEIPPNGQGVAALSMLNILENFDPDANPVSAAELHRKIEAMKLAYADLRYVSDPKRVKVPTAGMLSKPYAAARAKEISAGKANCDVKEGKPPAATSEDTTYLTVVDKEGNIVSWIQSVSGIWGSGVIVDGMGFHLHNRGGGFRLEAGHPNVLAGGKRPFHTIIPGFMEKDELKIGFGIMSGSNQPMAHAQFASYIADYGRNLQQAMEGLRFRGVGPGSCEVSVESRISAEALAGLSGRGHKLDVRPPYSDRMGRGNAVMRNTKTGVNFGASDPRADGAAVPQPLW